MVILIDGLSYYQFEQARDNGLIPNLAALGAAVKVNTVYRPVTNAGLAAIVTGQPPSVNGIVDRSTREPKVQTIFDLLEAEHKTHILVEGSASILKLNTDTVYSADLYNDGNTDDDVFGNAMAQIEKQPDYLLIHFHGVDDAGHNYGPLAEETMEVLAMVDVYTGLLLKEWTGKVIVVADHGMHFADPEGDHGNFQLEDMFVPYIIN
jgi:predicted AlkP superfamily pyrophosphatase or phosphodiesterase